MSLSSQQQAQSAMEPIKAKPLEAQTIFKCINVILVLILLFCINGFLQFRKYCETKGYYVFSTDALIWCGFGFFSIFVIFI